jgi:hypothetical protein
VLIFHPPRSDIVEVAESINSGVHLAIAMMDVSSVTPQHHVLRIAAARSLWGMFQLRSMGDMSLDAIE